MKTFTLSIITLFLVACGGNGGGDSTPAATAVTPPVVVVPDPVSITTQPVSITVNDGEVGFFNIAAINVENYRWQWSTDNVLWNDPGIDFRENSPQYNVGTVDMSLNGIYIHCVVSNSISSVTSNTVQLFVTPNTAPVITAQPEDIFAESTDPVTVSVTAVNATEYQWEYGFDGVNWSRSETRFFGKLKSPSFNFIPRNSDNRLKFRCIISNANGSVTSEICNVYVLIVTG